MIVLFTGLSLIVVLVAVAFAFTFFAPQIGQKPTGEHLIKIEESSNYKNDQFQNLIETKMGSFGDMMGTLPEYLRSKNGKPESPLPVKLNNNEPYRTDSLCYITWYGHSAFLIEIENQRILIDPMFGKSPSPVPFGTKRFDMEHPIPMENIDAVILSHDHYDHLDYYSILELKERVGHFFTPLGVGAHLKAWGVSPEKITELDWWQSIEFESLQLTACPARHFSGRGLTDRNRTQWASWVIKGQFQNIYFSGDSGYGNHFKEIGEKFGPFDFAMLECGQYNQAWEAIHMMPEQSVQAGIDTESKLVMPIHWGAFQLSIHPWDDPIKRFQSRSKQLNLPMIHPIIGERFCLGQDYPRTRWWE